MSTTVDITIRVTIDTPTYTAELESAINNLAAVMGVQAEDGLYTHGSPDAADDDNDFFAYIESVSIGVQEAAVDLDDPADVGARDACSACGQDIEWNGDGWWDRAGDGRCPQKVDNGWTFHTPTVVVSS